MTLDREAGFFDANRLWAWVVIIFLLVAAAGIRLWHLDDSTFIAERQYRSALIARLIYFDAAPPAADWRKEINRVSVTRKVVLEPPVFEKIVASLYLTLGREMIDVARLLSVTFWIPSAIFFSLRASSATSTLSDSPATTSPAARSLWPVGPPSHKEKKKNKNI